MGDKIEIIEKNEEPTLEIRAKAPVWKMPIIMGKIFKAIMEYLDKSKVRPSGAPFVRYLNINWDDVDKGGKILSFVKVFTYKWDMVIGFPVEKALEGNESIEAGVFPKGRYVKTIHRGAYKNVGTAYKQLITFMKQENIKYKDESVEIYINDPRTTKKEELETIVLIPVSE